MGVMLLGKMKVHELAKKLDKTNVNLERINDIIGEVESRLEPLKIQSEKAKDYLDNKEKLEQVEVALIASEITTYNLKYQEIKNDIKEKEEKLLHINNLLNNPEIDKYKKKIMI